MNSYILNADVNNREEALALLSELHFRLHNISDRDIFLEAVLRREALLSTYAERGIALPHGISAVTFRPAVTALSLKTPIPWGEHRVSTVFLLASPEDAALHMKSLSALAKALTDIQPY